MENASGDTGQEANKSPFGTASSKQLNGSDEEIKSEIWKNFGRIASARPDRKPLVSSVPSTSIFSDAEKTQVITPDGLGIFLEDLLHWDTSHWTDSHSKVVGFSSQKPEKKPCRDAEIQTLKISTKEAIIGSAERIDAKTQTELDYEPEDVSMIGRTFFNEPYPPSLFAFISKVGEGMIQEIRENIMVPVEVPSADKEQYFQKGSMPEEKEAKFDLLRTLTPTLLHRLRTKTLSEEEEIEALSVSWSPSGRQVAVGHGVFRHAGFCRHHSIPLTIWALVGPLLKQGPLHEILFDGCITCVQFHPKHGHFLAFGFQSGEVGLLNLNGAEEKPAFNILNPDESTQRKDSERFEFKQNDVFVNTDGSGHAMNVTSIRWIHLNQKDLRTLARKNSNPLPYMIVTASLDGYIGLWSLEKSGRITLERRYAIHTRAVPESYKRRNMSSYLYIKEIGIEAFDIFKMDPTRFVCSTFGSFIFTGNLLSKTKYTADELCNPRSTASDIYDPEAILIKQEVDYVRCLACNPFNPYLYVYGTQFGNLFIRNVKFNVGDAILKTYLAKKGTFDVAWSNRPMLFGVTNHKEAYIYDLALHERVEILTLEHSGFCRSLDWNKEEVTLLAVADSEGYVNIWALPQELTNESAARLVEVGELDLYAEFTDYTAPLMEEDEQGEGTDDPEVDLQDAGVNSSDELELLDELTRNHFPILKSRIENGVLDSTGGGGVTEDAENESSGSED